MNKFNPLDLLRHIDPVRCSYQEWVDVGMALHHEGCPVSAWDDWSRADPARYHAGECEKKWRSFGRNPNKVTGGTLYALARQQGWSPEPVTGGHALDWEDEIRDEMVIVNKDYLPVDAANSALKEPEPADWNPVQQLSTYLESLFDAADKVSYVTKTWEKDGKHIPSKGCSDRTAGELLEALNRYQNLEDVIGTVNESAGAWIRFNPMDGRDVRNDNVTAYNYALVESDSQDIARQYALMMELQLPIRMLVHSGGKSLHAIVAIDAGNYDEYRQRVDYLYTVCRKNGLEIDGANKNPSRLSRMPGVTRNGKKQYIVGQNLGLPSFAAWKEYVESVNDNLPDIESMADFYDNLPPLADELIRGVLRQGHKLLLAGPSKAGKSFALIALTIAIAEGKKWLGKLQCAQGRVLYINLELDRASCLHRFRDVYEALRLSPRGLNNVDIWNLRGRSLPMDKLAPKLIRRAMKRQYTAVIIDPIYKIITGDENSAEQMAAFCNSFDRICTELKTAVIYCHHHSKGAQGGKRSMDRASGSGVFARDPDALLDMIELELTDATVRFLQDQAANDAIRAALTESCPDWAERISQDDQCSRLRLQMAAGSLLAAPDYDRMLAAVKEAEAAALARTAWRIEPTLREFPKFPPLDVWFDYPVHRVDDTGILADLAAEETKPAWEKGAKARKASASAKREDDAARFAQAVSNANIGQPPTVKELAEYLNIPVRTCRDQIKKFGFVIDKNTSTVRKSVAATT